MNEKKEVYTRRRGRNTSAIITAIGIMMIMTSVMGEISMIDGGGALIMVGILFALTGIGIFPLMRKRDKLYENLVNSINRLACWQYDAEAWKAANEQRLGESKAKNTVMIIFIDALMFIITVIISIADPSAAGGMFLIMGSVAAIVTISAIIAPKIIYHLASKQVPMVLIGEKGVVYGNELHLWDGVMGQFQSAMYNKKEKILRISYLYIGGMATRQQHEVVLPVPKGHELEAEQVVTELKK
jgi:hypothetical protein